MVVKIPKKKVCVKNILFDVKMILYSSLGYRGSFSVADRGDGFLYVTLLPTRAL